jgi:hypothetical protein
MAQHAYDIITENALLGSMLSSPDTTAPFLLSVPTEAYWQPRAQVLAAIMRDMLIKRIPIDPVTVLAEIEDAGLISRIDGTWLHMLYSGLHTSIHAQQYAERVCELYGRRRLAEEMERQMQFLDAEWETGDPTPMADVIGRLRATLDELVAYATLNVDYQPPTLTDLLNGVDEWDWLVPGLLERTDRLIITGEEGLGKTEFLTQVTACIAASIHPFMGEAIGDGNEEFRVTVLDCENSESQARRRWRRILRVVNSTRDALGLPPIAWDKRLYIDFRPEGLDLLKGSDAAWLERFVNNTAPDLLMVGPLYKLHKGADLNDERQASALLSVLDGIRTRHHCAMMLEAHAGQGKSQDGDRFMRPRGSAVFMGWPEFGIGLRRNKDNREDADVIAWRGHREERDWPAGLVRGHDGLLPWRPTNEYYDRPNAQWNGDVS